MPSRYWVAALVFGLIASGATGQDGGEQSREARGAESAATQQGQPAQPFSIPVRIIEDPEATEARQRSEQISEELQERDLEAQEGMERATNSIEAATWWMLWVAAVNAVFVAIGTGLLVWTLGLTRQANRAAMEAVEVTDRIGTLQTRAYLALSDARVTRVAEGEIPRVQIGITNSGQSPAFNFRVRAIVGYIDTDPNTRKLRMGEIEDSKGNIGPGVTSYVTIPMTSRILSRNDLRGFHAEEYHFIVGATYRYDTIFGQVRRGVVRLASHNPAFRGEDNMVPLKSCARNNRAN